MRLPYSGRPLLIGSKRSWIVWRITCWSCDRSYVGHVTGHVAGLGLACIYINFVSLLGFPYSCDRLHVGHVTGHVTWPMYISAAFSFVFPSSLFFPSLLFSTCSSSGMPAIASRHLMCGFLNRAVPLHIMTNCVFNGPRVSRLTSIL